MNITKILGYAVLICFVLVALFFILNAYIYHEKQGDDTEHQGDVETVTLEGTVTAVNLDEMMVDGPGRITFKTPVGESFEVALPSMGRLLCAAVDTVASPGNVAIGDIVSVRGNKMEDGKIVPCDDVSHYFRVEGQIQNAEIGIEFPFRKGPNGYVVTTEEAEMNTSPDFVLGYQFMLESDVLEMSNTTTPREGPPVIALRVYKNSAKLWPAVWVTRHPLESNIELAMTDPVETAVGGAKAIKYTVDGLYATNTYVVTNGDFVFIFTGSYIDDSSPMKADLETMIQNTMFIPTKG